MTDTKSTPKDDVKASLWSLHCRILGLGLLLKQYGHSEPDTYAERGFNGMGELLIEAGAEIDDVLEKLSSHCCDCRPEHSE